MPATLFNDDWTVKPKTSIFAQIGQSADSGKLVRLPHDALISAERDPAGSGKGAYFPSAANFEYTKTFLAPDAWRDRNVRVEFQGAYRDAAVYLNDEYVGQRPYGYSIFEVNLDDHLRFGEENTLRVEVRAQDDSRWYTGVGITRDVLLHVTDPYRISSYGVQARLEDIDEEIATVKVDIALLNGRRHRATARVDVTIRDADGHAVANATTPATVSGGQAGTVSTQLYLPAPRRWSTDDPYLYSVDVHVREGDTTLDRSEVPLGLRTIQLDPQRGLRLNGTPIKIRGACVHHDNGALGGVALAAAEERRVRILKEAGFNAIRSAHNPISIPMLEACDRLGVLVMDETFDVWTESKSSFDYSLDFPEWWERDVESMVLKDRNHPSVIFYSIGNEIPEIGTAPGAEWNQRLAAKVRQIDPTRPVTNGVNGFVAALKDVMQMMQQATDAGAAGGVNDAMGSAGDMMNQISASDIVSEKLEEPLAALDVAGINYGDSRYELDRTAAPNRILVGTETFPGHIDVLWRLVLDNPNVIGDFTWAGWDYLGEVGVGRTRYLDDNDMAFEAPYPWISAWVGDIDMSGRRRAISYYRETVFGLRERPFIGVHRPQNHGRAAMTGGWSWPDIQESWTWSVDPGSPIRVDVYSTAYEVELLCNGESLGRARTGIAKPFIAEFDVTYEPGVLEAVCYSHGGEVSRSQIRSAAGEAILHLTPSAMTIADGPGDAVFIEIEILDASGIRVTDDEKDIQLTVSGAGELVGVMSGRPNPEHPLTGDVCQTLDGRVLAIVRPLHAGTIEIAATAGTLQGGVTVQVVQDSDD
ncbi:glycoside hydrolase family 2 TIM barrel-domain containing protein [Streptomyces sp. TG1A-60]|uniref:glycoside hydrolase family 2 TIM barrel-domain containing protein n=1 Tax=Streptomyces sp. TG1A-60 TaxID=3129111 RepID=UPI0030D4133F